MSRHPRVRVAAVIPMEGRIVVVRHRRDDVEYLLLPGGGVEWGESLGHSLAREVAEETGLGVRVTQPLLITDTIAPDGSRHIVNVTFLAAVESGRLTHTSSDPRLVGVELVTPDELLDVDFRPPIASWLVEAAEAAFSGPAVYLGQLWVPEQTEDAP